MPFTSRAQARLFFAKERAGELPKGTALRWAHETDDIKKLPNKVKKKKGLRKIAAAMSRRFTGRHQLVNRLTEHVGSRELAIKILQARKHMKLDGVTLTAAGKRRDAMTAHERARDRAARGIRNPTRPMKKTASEIFFDALVKTAFAVTREGHEYDTRRARIEEKAAAQQLKLMAKHKALPDRGESNFAGAKKRFRGFMAPESAWYLRHHAYTARKHAQGKNAYNPFGGFTVPSKYERGGTRNRFGKIKVQD